MKEWIPMPGTSKDAIIQVALKEFSVHGYKGVNIAELAEKAKMTTGAIYHHFGSKAKLYEVIRTEMEQRILDRMEGAASLFNRSEDALQASLITGLNYAVHAGICQLISEDAPYNQKDRVEEFVSRLCNEESLPLEIIVLSSWRAVLRKLAVGEISSEQGIELLKWLFKNNRIQL